MGGVAMKYLLRKGQGLGEGPCPGEMKMNFIWTIFTTIRNWFQKKPKKTQTVQTFYVPGVPISADPDRIRPTKAYADQRQKAKHNRKRKPNKKTKNLYSLER